MQDVADAVDDAVPEVEDFAGEDIGYHFEWRWMKCVGRMVRIGEWWMDGWVVACGGV